MISFGDSAAMDLYVLRHGIAEDRDSQKYPDDTERPLTRKGFERLILQTKGMNSIALSLDLIMTSPLLRAVQTAEVVHEELADSGPLVVSDSLVPWAEPQEFLTELRDARARVGSVMIVGHEPHLSGLVSLISSGTLDCAIRLKKGALCMLRISSLGSGRCGRIEWSLTPKQMLKLG